MAALEKTAVVLLSGGLDSATVLAMARSQGYACHALSISYGQRHQVELAAARKVATALGGGRPQDHVPRFAGIWRLSTDRRYSCTPRPLAGVDGR